MLPDVRNSDTNTNNNTDGERRMDTLSRLVALFCAGIGVASAATLDMDADQHADLWWVHAESGDHWTYLMDGLQLKASVPIGFIPPEWRLIGRGDFDGDGRADALWRHPNGDLWVLLMEANQIRYGKPLAKVGADWRLEAVADWNGDGTDDLLWFHPASGQLWLFGLKNAALVDSRGVLVANSPWRLLAAADVDGDHKADLLWREPTTGQVWLIRQDGQAIVKQGHWANIGLNWRLAAVGDFNGDGTDDLWWREATTGSNALLLTQQDGFQEVGVAAVDPVWQLAQAADFDGDGTDDVWWRNPLTGDNWLYRMRDAGVASQASAGSVPVDWRLMQNPPLEPAAPVPAAAKVRYDFSAGDSLLSKNGWTFWGEDWPIAPVPGSDSQGLVFDYEATTPGQYPANTELRFSMPAADEFWLKVRLHVPANYRLRTDTLIKVGDAKAAGWQLGDQLLGADAVSTGSISAFDSEGVYVRYAQKGAYNEVWGSADSPKSVRNLTRNNQLTSAGRSTWDTGSKLLAVWNDDYSYSGTGSSIILGMISDFVFTGDQSSQFTAAYRGAGEINDGNRTNFSNLAGGELIREADHGKYLDLMLHARFSSAPGAKDGVLQTWVRYQGEAQYRLRHNLTDADLDKGVSQKSWQAGYLMGWSNAGYDQDTRFQLSLLEYWLDAPAELQGALP